MHASARPGHGALVGRSRTIARTRQCRPLTERACEIRWSWSCWRRSLSRPGSTAARRPRPCAHYPPKVSNPWATTCARARMLGTDEQGRVAYRIMADNLEELPRRAAPEARRRADRIPAGGRGYLADLRDSGHRAEGRLRARAERQREPPQRAAGRRQAGRHRRRDTAVPPEDLAAPNPRQPVSISVGDWHVEAGRFRTLLKGDVLELESKVHGKFAP